MNLCNFAVNCQISDSIYPVVTVAVKRFRFYGIFRGSVLSLMVTRLSETIGNCFGKQKCLNINASVACCFGVDLLEITFE